MAEAGEAGRAEIARYEALAEAAYDEMYETRSPAGPYSELKKCFAMAIFAAKRAGLDGDRLEHCKAVYRSQFSSL
jgi:hypothetical protein